jgi:hypothetical protein
MKSNTVAGSSSSTIDMSFVKRLSIRPSNRSYLQLFTTSISPTDRIRVKEGYGTPNQALKHSRRLVETWRGLNIYPITHLLCSTRLALRQIALRVIVRSMVSRRSANTIPDERNRSSKLMSLLETNYSDPTTEEKVGLVPLTTPFLFV